MVKPMIATITSMEKKDDIAFNNQSFAISRSLMTFPFNPCLDRRPSPFSTVREF